MYAMFGDEMVRARVERLRREAEDERRARAAITHLRSGRRTSAWRLTLGLRLVGAGLRLMGNGLEP